jgi:hypothetical protein
VWLYRVDPATLTVVGPPLAVGTSVDWHRVAGSPRRYGYLRGDHRTSLAVGEGALWVAHSGGLWRVDPSDPRPTLTVPLPVKAVAAGDGAVWALGHHVVYRIEPRTAAVVATIPLKAAHRIAVDEGTIWVATHWTTARQSDEPGWRGGAFDPQPLPPPGPTLPEIPSALFRIDPQTHAVSAPIPLDTPYGLAVGHGALWIMLPDKIERLDPRTNQVVASFALCRGGEKTCRWPVGVVATPDAVWGADRFIYRIDPATNTMTVRDYGPTIRAIAVGEGAVWLGVSILVESTWSYKVRVALARWRVP